jgi:hypothetical protein
MENTYSCYLWGSAFLPKVLITCYGMWVGQVWGVPGGLDVSLVNQNGSLLNPEPKETNLLRFA